MKKNGTIFLLFYLLCPWVEKTKELRHHTELCGTCIYIQVYMKFTWRIFLSSVFKNKFKKRT